jgi:hypothetical protein
MATTCTFKCYRGRKGQGLGLLVQTISGTLSLNDVTVNTTTTVSGGAAIFNTAANVHADVQNAIAVNSTDAATAGVDAGWYYKTDAATFTKPGIVYV